MKTYDDARELCIKERDNFYATAFMIEAWLGDAVLEAATEYAVKKNAKDRAMQTRQAWGGFLKVFGHAQDEEFPHVVQSLYRFTEYEDVQADMLLQAIFPVSVENECLGDFIGPNALHVAKTPAEAIRLMWRTVERWCDWLDALIHFSTHEIWHLSPVMLDPDAEKRELAALGINQRVFARLSAFGKSMWKWHHGEASVRFKGSAKWQMAGKAMAAQELRPWNYPLVDNVAISLWPLVKRHNWTYRDLLAVVRRILPSPHSYPLESDQTMASYCQNVLGLRKSGPNGRSAPDGKPPGWEVAMKLCRCAPPQGSS